jgi:saccharopine dehydrogenase-like NADP-dependent oxidoreductase
MTYDFCILGADGQIGVLCTRYLLKSGYSVLTSDVYRDTIAKEIAEHPDHQASFRYCDHRYTTQIADTISAAGPGAVVINCADDFYNDNVFDACLLRHAHHIDFGCSLKDTRKRLRRNNEFNKAGLTAIIGCGSVPGIGGLMMQWLYFSEFLHDVERVETGFAWDSNRADFVPPFFLFVVMYELSQSPEIMVNGRIKRIKPLSDSFERDFPLVGKQRVYAIPHPEPWTHHHYFGVKNVKFYAGFPKHSLDVILALIKVGLNRNKVIDMVSDSGYVEIHPCDFITAVCKQIKFPRCYKESEVLWVETWGKNDSPHYLMECLVPPIKGYEQYGCNVDTAFPGCEIAIAVRNRGITVPGVYTTESVSVPHQIILAKMQELGFQFRLNGKRMKL